MIRDLKTLIAGVILILTFTARDTYASGLNKLLKFIDQSGGMSNYNAPAIIRDQQGGFMTAGSLADPRRKTQNITTGTCSVTEF
jgi:hypothetical protein